MDGGWSTQAYQIVVSAQQSRELYGLRPGSKASPMSGCCRDLAACRRGEATAAAPISRPCLGSSTPRCPAGVQAPSSCATAGTGTSSVRGASKPMSPPGCCSYGSVYAARAVASRARWSRGAGRFRTRRGRRGRTLRADGDGDGGCRACGCP